MSPREQAARVLRETFSADPDLDWQAEGDWIFHVVLPGERKLQTPVRFDVGEHSLAVHAFVCRRPDENHAGVYRWMLERNLRLYALAFAVDQAGDIYLDARLPLASATPDEIDRLLGAVLAYSDDSFNTLLELGFASSIRAEWEWRIARGESTRNLEAFIGPLRLERPAEDDA